MDENYSFQHRQILERLAEQAMRERGLWPEFSAEALRELNRIDEPARSNGSVRDMRRMLWCSIDNEDSEDLDQLSVAEAQKDGRIRIFVAIADVDELVNKGSAIDAHARHNTTSVYTPARIFPMLPEKLSTNLTSLDFDEDRLAMVVEMVVAPSGMLEEETIYPARVHNHAKLAYPDVAAWLEGDGPVPPAAATVNGLPENLRLQDQAAQQLRTLRHENGALNLETVQARARFDGDQVSEVEAEDRNRAKELIEDFMIAANGVSARYLAQRGYASIRRVVRTPKRWERIVDIAAQRGYFLPEEPDPVALDEFLNKEKAADPLRFPDLSLTIIKLMGAGEYAAEAPGQASQGHFGLAVKDYAHSTAPNRRYSDLITQRILKAALSQDPPPYTYDELQSLAEHCTRQEDASNKVERQMTKSAAALVLKNRIGEKFDSIVTGASPKGTWVRLLHMPVEGRLLYGFEGADVGERLRVQLDSVDVERGFINFTRISRRPND